MARRVICISRILGSGGVEVGRRVAAELGYRHVDEEIVLQAAEQHQLDVADLADVERRTTWLDRLLQGISLAGAADGVMMGVVGSPAVPPTPDAKSLRDLIQQAIHEAADRGDVVIVSHAASYALQGRDDVLRVFVTASPDTRAARAKGDLQVDDKGAAKAIETDDAGRAAYLKRFYGVSSESPTDYDLVLNTDTITPEHAASVIVSVAKA
ncbi:MAG TPA: cytidylate kinase-like family protein [Ilumatobacteraceae bacterium]